MVSRSKVTETLRQQIVQMNPIAAIKDAPKWKVNEVQLYYSMLQHSSTTANRRVKPACWTLLGGAAWYIFVAHIFLSAKDRKWHFLPIIFSGRIFGAPLAARARQVCCSKSAISRILHFYKIPNSFKSPKRLVAKQKTNAREDWIKQIISMGNRFNTAGGI